MRIVLSQMDATVGAVDDNVSAIIQAIDEARVLGAELVVFPAWSVSGYPLEGLAHDDEFVARNLRALLSVSEAAVAPVLVGHVVADTVDRPVESVSLVAESTVLARRSVEEAPVHVEVAGSLVAFVSVSDTRELERMREITERGVRVVVLPMARPFERGRGEANEAELAELAKRHGVWVVSCNLAGAHDGMVFDGRSVVIAPDGAVVARASGFDEELLAVDIDPDGVAGSGPVAAITSGDEEVYEALVQGLRGYARKNGFTDAVLGLSGGVDSALVATLAADCLGPDHVHGVLMPSAHSSQGSIDDALALAENLGIETRTIPIAGPNQAFTDALAPSFTGMKPDKTEENLQARVRGTLLMSLSNKFGWLTLATGNKSESSVGYATLYGDTVGGYAPIVDLFKTDVYRVCRWRNLQGDEAVIPEATLTKAPSAELRPGQVDQDSLPDYDTLDAVLRLYVEQGHDHATIIEEGFDPELVTGVLKMTDAAEYKRRQSAPGTIITFAGKDRARPITNGFKRRV